MDALRARLSGDLDQPLDDEIAFGRGRRADQMRLVAQANMQGAFVGLRVDRDGAKPEPFRGARHPAGNLAAVGGAPASADAAAGAVAITGPSRQAAACNTTLASKLRARRLATTVAGSRKSLSVAQSAASQPRVISTCATRP